MRNAIRALPSAALLAAAVPVMALAGQPALLHNKVMDSHGESDVIDGRDAQTDPAEVLHDQLARV